MHAFNRRLIEDFRATGGRMSGAMAGRQLMVLTTKGRRSARLQSVVIGYRPAGDAMVVIASNNGAEGDPHWYRNLLAEPRATAEVGDRKLEVRARTVEGEERDRLGALVEYLERQEALTSRRIPVVLLEPVP
jgi:deazaflavin-dependent oxidoreductase (nitroreductase family)